MQFIHNSIQGCISVWQDGGVYWCNVAGANRQCTASEILDATKAQRIVAINTECRARLLARYGDAAEQVSRSLGIYGASEQQAMQAGIAATIDASNAASNAILAATTVQDVEAVTAAWPVI